MKNTLIWSSTGTFEYTDPVFGVTMTKTVRCFSFGSFGSNIDGDLSIPDQAKLLQYAGMQNLIKQCVDNAEDVKSRLLNFYIHQNNSNSDLDKSELMKVDLMKLKDDFMFYIRKHKIYKELEDYNSTRKLKNFSVPFNRFVLDRNIYTHGQLSFIKPDFQFAIEYIDKDIQRYAYINIDILKSYNEFYKIICLFISKYQIFLQNGQLNNA